MTRKHLAKLVAGTLGIIYAAVPLKNTANQTLPVMTYFPPEEQVEVLDTRYKPTDEELKLVARVIYSEGARCSENERIAIAHTILNRLNDPGKRFGKNIKEVVKSSAYNGIGQKRKINRELNAKYWDCGRVISSECYDLAKGVFNGKYPDPTNGATHYFNPSLCAPTWDARMERVGFLESEEGYSKHVFYTEKSI